MSVVVNDNTSDVSSDTTDLSNDNDITLTTTTTTTVVPKRSEVVNEDYVLDDKVLLVTGADIYLNSAFIRSVIPADKFPQFARNENLDERQQFVDNQWFDEWAKMVYEQATDEEKQFFYDNIDDFVIDVNIVTVSDPKTENEKNIVMRSHQFGEINSYIFNSFGLAEATVRAEVYPAKDDMTTDYMSINPFSYRKLEKKNRTIAQDEFVVHAGTLAQYFNSQCKYDELQNLSDMFGAGLDINRLRAFNEERGYEEGWNDEEPTKEIAYDEDPAEYPADEDNGGRGGRSSSSAIPSEPGSSRISDFNWIFANAKNGDVISVGGGTPSSGYTVSNKVIYGTLSHTGLFNRKRFIAQGSTENTTCMLASYPSGSKKKGVETDRWEYASYEPLKNFMGGYYISVNRSINNKGDDAVKTAEEHFYGDGTKTDYHKWCYGYYNCILSIFHPLFAIYCVPFFYCAYSEFLTITNASKRQPSTTNYCSYISWYAYNYSNADLNLNSDPNNYTAGNMIVPDDIANSCSDKIEYSWVTYYVGNCHFESKQVPRYIYKKTTDAVYTEKQG